MPNAARFGLLTALVWGLASACANQVEISTLPDAPCAGVDVGEMQLVEAGGTLMLLAPDGTAFSVIWPSGFSATNGVGGGVVRDRTGSTVARTGEALQIGGGLNSRTRVVTVCEVNGASYP